MRPISLPRIVVSFALGFGAIVCTSTDALSTLAGPEAKLVRRVNQLRIDHGLIQLRGSPTLGAVARAHADEMARHGYLSHINLVGQNPLERVQAAGVDGFRLLAENIAASGVRGDRTAVAIDEWMQSERHRENLLNPAFNTTGVAVVDAPGGRTIFVQLFATFQAR